MSGNIKPFHLFDAFGIEMEYMLVNSDTLNVLPLTDEVIHSKTGEYISEFENGEIAWSNELVLHVIELKTNGPKNSLHHLSTEFQKNVSVINQILKKNNGMLLPSGIHPFMNPFTEAKIWPHEYNEVYESYNRIFDCKGHGWSNLQSTHLNLPFCDDEEFGMLHAAIRLVLPIIPALAASSPLIDGNFRGYKDTRLEVYRHNQEKVPSVAGKIIPERAFTKKNYQEQILDKIYHDIAEFDSNKILQNEWLNSRGAIPRFDRNTIEIRIIDNQECPKADMAMVAAIVETLKAMIDERWISCEKQMEWDENRLSEIFLKTVKDAENAVIDDAEYLRSFGLNEKVCTAGHLWKKLIPEIMKGESFGEFLEPLNTILKEGTLSTRILKSLDGNYEHENIVRCYAKIGECLEKGEMFMPQ